MLPWDFWNYAGWAFLGLCGIRFLVKDVPKILHKWRNTGPYGDKDPSGNDNVNRRLWDYM